MPFFFIPTALGVCFFLIWAFIGGMMFRDSQIAVQRELESDIAVLPLSAHRAPHMSIGRSKAKRPGGRRRNSRREAISTLREIARYGAQSMSRCTFRVRDRQDRSSASLNWAAIVGDCFSSATRISVVRSEFSS